MFEATESVQAEVGFRPILSALRDFVRELEPGAYASSDVPVVLRQLAEAEKLCANAKVLLARRADEEGARSRSGETDASQVLSEGLGEPAGKSRRDLDTARRVAGQPELEEALRSGRISSEQASVMLPALEANPEVGGELLDLAEHGSFAELRGECRSVVAAAMSEEEANDREARLRARRQLQIGTTSEGAVYLRGELPPIEGALVRNALEREAKVVFDEARREGRRETRDAYLADALVNLVRDGSSCPGHGAEKLRTAPRAEIVLHVSAEALRRHSLEAGEFCDVPGVGPVPLSTVEDLLGSAFVKLVVRDGVDILSVTHFGHFIPAHLDTAVRARDRFCVVPGCGINYRLERDHVVPVEEGGPTRIDNLAMLCRRHHYLKTHRYWRLVGGPGRWRFVNIRPEQPFASADDPLAPARPGEPTVGLARPIVTPPERIGAEPGTWWGGDDPPDESDPPDEPDEPGRPDESIPSDQHAHASYSQQTFACRARTVVMRLAS